MMRLRHRFRQRPNGFSVSIGRGGIRWRRHRDVVARLAGELVSREPRLDSHSVNRPVVRGDPPRHAPSVHPNREVIRPATTGDRRPPRGRSMGRSIRKAAAEEAESGGVRREECSGGPCLPEHACLRIETAELSVEAGTAAGHFHATCAAPNRYRSHELRRPDPSSRTLAGLPCVRRGMEARRPVLLRGLLGNPGRGPLSQIPVKQRTGCICDFPRPPSAANLNVSQPPSDSSSNWS